MSIAYNILQWKQFFTQSITNSCENADNYSSYPCNLQTINCIMFLCNCRNVELFIRRIRFTGAETAERVKGYDGITNCDNCLDCYRNCCWLVSWAEIQKVCIWQNHPPRNYCCFYFTNILFVFRLFWFQHLDYHNHPNSFPDFDFLCSPQRSFKTS